MELVIQEETTPKDTVERFRHLALQEKVDAIHGLISTGVTLAVAPVAEDERVLLQCWMERHKTECKSRCQKLVLCSGRLTTSVKQ